MKRSTVNRTIETAKEAFAAIGFRLPPFAFWSVADWKIKGPEADEIRRCMLGNDNCWLEPCERFCQIEDDEPPRHYLVHEYPPAC